MDDSGIAASSPESATTEQPGDGKVSEPKSTAKSWACLVKTSDGGTGSAVNGASSAPKAFTITSEGLQEIKHTQKLIHLGEILTARKLMKKSEDHRTLYLIPRGMMNRGNACYGNAVLQSLVFCPPFFHLMESIANALEFSQFTLQIPAVTKSFVDLVLSFKQIPSHLARKVPLKSEDAPIDPSFIYDTLEESGDASHKRMLSRGTQEDAQEFLNQLLSLVHEEMVKGYQAVGGLESNQAQEDESQEEWTRVSKGQRKSVLRENDAKESPLFNIFGGKLRSIQRHSRGKGSENTEPFFMLGLPIHDPHVKSVFGAIEYFMRDERISGYMDRGRSVEITRQYRFDQLPSVLILHLKYFQYSMQGGVAKLRKDIDFEPTLKLPERWFVQGNFNPARHVYKLFAVVFHWGEQLDSGHYTACLFHPAVPSQWIEANDSTISVVNFDYLRNPEPHRVPYLLFYRLQPDTR